MRSKFYNVVAIITAVLLLVLSIIKIAGVIEVPTELRTDLFMFTFFCLLVAQIKDNGKGKL